MHPRVERVGVDADAPGNARQLVLEFVRERGDGAPARGGRPLRARHGHELLGRLVERDHAPARRHALPRPAARGAARGGIRIYAAHEHRPRARRCRGAARARSTRSSTSSCASTRRCRRRACRTSCSRLRYAVPQWQRRAEAGAAARARQRLAHARVDGVDWYWPADEDPQTRGAATTRCGCWRRSIRSSGTAAASSCSGAGPTASRPTRRRRSASSATTRCRCCGATA